MINEIMDMLVDSSTAFIFSFPFFASVSLSVFLCPFSVLLVCPYLFSLYRPTQPPFFWKFSVLIFSIIHARFFRVPT